MRLKDHRNLNKHKKDIDVLVDLQDNYQTKNRIL